MNDYSFACYFLDRCHREFAHICRSQLGNANTPVFRADLTLHLVNDLRAICSSLLPSGWGWPCVRVRQPQIIVAVCVHCYQPAERHRLRVCVTARTLSHWDPVDTSVDDPMAPPIVELFDPFTEQPITTPASLLEFFHNHTTRQRRGLLG